MIEEKLTRAGMKIATPSLAVNWAPDKDEIQRCFEFGKEFAKNVAEAN